MPNAKALAPWPRPVQFKATLVFTGHGEEPTVEGLAAFMQHEIALNPLHYELRDDHGKLLGLIELRVLHPEPGPPETRALRVVKGQ